MRMKILLAGDNPVAAMADTQLLRDRGIWVFNTFNMQHIPELIDEIKPNVLFFAPHAPNKEITDAYSQVITDIQYTHIPVIIALADDDVYLVTRKRTLAKEIRTSITDNILTAIKEAYTAHAAHNFFMPATSGKTNYR